MTKISINLALRRIVAILVGSAILATVSWGIYRSYFEEKVNFLFSDEGQNLPKTYHISLSSIDEVAGTIHIESQVVFDQQQLFLDHDAINLFPDFRFENGRVLFGPFLVEDLLPVYRNSGLGLVQSDKLSYHHDKPDTSFKEAVPTMVQRDLRVDGNPSTYPFDRYIIIGMLTCDAFLTKDGKEYIPLPGEGYQADFRVPGFILHTVDGSDLEQSDEATQRALRSISEGHGLPYNKEQKESELARLHQRYRPDLWTQGRFAFVIERPFFVRFFAGFLATAAFLSLAFVAFSQNPRNTLVNAVGYFLGLWSIRQMLSASSPKTTTLVDYFSLVLYALLIAIVVTRLLWGFRSPSGQNDADC